MINKHLAPILNHRALTTYHEENTNMLWSVPPKTSDLKRFTNTTFGDIVQTLEEHTFQ